MPAIATEQNRRMSWDEMVKEYPDRWVVIKDAEMDGPDIISGIIVTVKSDDDIMRFRIDNQKKGYKFYRTSEGDFLGSSTQTLIFPLTNRSVRQVFDYDVDLYLNLTRD